MTWVLVCLILVLDVLIAVDWLVMAPRAKHRQDGDMPLYRLVAAVALPEETPQ